MTYHEARQRASEGGVPVFCGRVKRPDLFDVLEVVRECPGAQSYVYRNKLVNKGHRDFTTALVLNRLRKLEALGRVRRVSTSKFPPFYWTPAEQPRARATEPHPTGHPATDDLTKSPTSDLETRS